MLKFKNINVKFLILNFLNYICFNSNYIFLFIMRYFNTLRWFSICIKIGFSDLFNYFWLYAFTAHTIFQNQIHIDVLCKEP